MNAILQADDAGALQLPPWLLPGSRPRQKYRVAEESGSVTIQALTELSTIHSTAVNKGDPRLQELLGFVDEMRARTKDTGHDSQGMWDELRKDKG